MAFCVRARLPATSMTLRATGDFGSANCPCARAPKAINPALAATPPTRSRRVMVRFIVSSVVFRSTNSAGRTKVRTAQRVTVGPESASGKHLKSWGVAMKITGARVIVCCPGRNFVTLKVETDEGLTGLGDATLNGRELAVASYLTDHVIPCLIGRDAHQIEDIWQYLYKGAYWRRGPVTMTAIAAVDTALWDIKAKAAGLPLDQLLGGQSRPRIMVYGHAKGRDTEESP